MWFDLIRKRVDECLHEVRSNDLKASEFIMTSASGRYTSQAQSGATTGGMTAGVSSHPDIDLVSPIYCPIIVIANKFDTLKDKEPVERRVICQALRFMCHQAGASLLTCGFKDKVTIYIYSYIYNDLI